MLKKISTLKLLSFILLVITGCASTTPPPAPPGYPKPYRVYGRWYQPIPSARGFSQVGIASWYGKKFHGRKTSSGEIYNMHAMTAAHKTLPFGALVLVENLDNGKKTKVIINDRGPFIKNRIIDLSYSAAKAIGMVGPGTARVRISAIGMDKSRYKAYDPLSLYSGRFTIQVGAFKDRKNAEKLVKRLDKKFKNAHIVEFKSNEGTFFRVRVGICSSLATALRYEKKMAEYGFEQAFIVAE